jgi:diguanylate cyclase (GGDEF)-like protein
MFANTIQRLPFRHALFVSTTISVAYVAAIAGSDHMPGPAAFVAVAMLAACAYTTLASNYYHERDARRNFLLTLREKFRHAQADAASKIDALTGLGNRRRLGDQLQQLWRSDRDEDSSVAVVMVDVDHFKSFNDTYGHPAGDSCLKRIASCIVAELRNENDLAFRYGGEELVIVLPDTDIIGATHLAERLRRAIEGLAIPNENAGTRKFVTASLGVAASAPSVLSSDELIAAADVALYAAKRNGRNRVCPPLAGATPQQGENVIPIARAS